jgi:DeoR/GlpR family transcriptional regulator of sugar metabolism
MTVRKLKAAERQLRIRELLEGQEFVDLETLCRRLKTSESTVRRDLAVLEKEQALRRVHGGALGPGGLSSLGDFAGQSAHQPEEKARIARVAASLLEGGQSVIFDGGSTTAAVARELTGASLNVLTNSLPIADILKNAPGIELTLTGGYLYPRLGVLVGPFSEQMLSGVAADVAVMGIAGVTETGFSNNNTLIVGSERKMIEVSQRVIIVADHTKFGRAGMVPLAPLDAIDTVISDHELPPEWQSRLEDVGVRVVLA